ncbi:MAG TPA: hypothetical protein VF746_18800 [Longimicrobium sp.]|jgi:hypothetical protein
MKAFPPHRSTRRTRPSYVAAPPLTRPDDAAEGADVMAEVPGPAGVLLFGALRDFMLWVETPAGERKGLFAYGAGVLRREAVAAAAPDQELWGPLLSLAQMTDAPEAADPGRLAYACRAVARWAERRGAPGTRLAFAQAAALALPSDPKLALDTARLARDLARHAPAETWFRAAIKLARRRDWESYAWGFIGLGVLYIRTGNYPAAQTVIGRALRTSVKRRMRPLQASAHHHLFNLLVDASRLREAYEHARAALQAYDADNPNLPVLAHDLGRYWLVVGRHDRAVPVLEAVAPRLDQPTRMVATANLAHAAARSGDRSRYEAAREQALGMAETYAAGARAAEVLTILSWADAEAREWGRAEELARRAQMLATARGESDVRILAEQHLERVRDRRAAEAPVREPETAGSGRFADRLARELVRTLAPA